MAYFNIKSLENLSRDVNQSDYYDLFVQTYVALTNDVQLRFYIVDRSREMRLDLVCTDLYGDISNLQMLMYINNIENPFGIRENDLLFWVNPKDLSKVQTIDPKVLEDGRDNLINAFKASIADPARAAYLQNRGTDQLPANVLPDNAPKIQIDNNTISVGGNLFTNPNTQLRNEETTTSSLGIVDAGVEAPIPAVEDDTERVLVRRFVRSGNSTIEEGNS